MKRSVRSAILERFGVEPVRPRLALIPLPHPRAVRAPEKLYAGRKPSRRAPGGVGGIRYGLFWCWTLHFPLDCDERIR